MDVDHVRAAGVAELEARVADLEAENASLRDRADRLRQEAAAIEGKTSGGERARSTQEPFVDGVPRTLPPGTVQGVEDALRAYLPDPDSPWLPGVTRWRDADLELPEGLTDPGGAVTSHGELTLQLINTVIDASGFGGPVSAEFGFPWEITARVLRTDEDEALAVVQQWGGLGDDSVAGIDYRFTLRQGPSGWYVGGTAERNQCTRNDRLPGEAGLPDLCA